MSGGGTLPELDPVLVIARVQSQLSPFGDFWSIRNAYDSAFAAPANWVSVPGAGAGPAPAPPTASSSAIPETVQAPPLDIYNPPEIEVNAPRVPLSDLTNEELLQIGTDSALYELDARRGIPESQRSFAPYSLERVKAPPKVAPIVRSFIGTIARTITPLFGLLIPAPGGKQDEWEDLPLEWRAPPRKPPAGPVVPLDPILPPNWQDIAYEPNPNFNADDLYDPFAKYRGYPLVRLPIGDPIRRSAPIPIGPGIFEPFDDPLRVPEPQPFRTPSPGPANPASPFVVPATPGTPLADPRRFADPFPFPTPRPVETPRIGRPIPAPIGDPFVLAPPVPGVPTAPPGVFVPPGLPQLLLPPGLDTFRLPAPDAFAPPNRADPCNCAEGKKKEKKKKRKPREICYRGTYREYKDGTSKKKLEQVACEPKKKAKLDSARSAARRLDPVIPLF